jgi:hypothetical protein
MEKKKKKGAPKKNRNAGKHGFYSQFLDKAEQARMEQAIQVEGVDEEIALLRLRLIETITEHPERLDLALKAASVISTLCRTRYQLSKEQKKSLKEAITRVITEIALPLGIKTLFK